MKKADFVTYAGLTLGIGGLAFFGGCTFMFLSEAMSMRFRADIIFTLLGTLLPAFFAFLFFHSAAKKILKNKLEIFHQKKWAIPLALVISFSTYMIVDRTMGDDVLAPLFVYAYIAIATVVLSATLLLLQAISQLIRPADKTNSDEDRKEEQD